MEVRQRWRKLRFKAHLRLQHSVRPRVARQRWFSSRLPWSVWCRLCRSDAEGIVEELASRSARPLQVVQIGSNDGLANDPLHAVIRAHGWRALLVEPLPRLYERLQANYEGVPGIRFANVAVAPEAGRITMYTVDARPGDEPWVNQIASLDRDQLLRHEYALPDVEARIVPVEVDCLPLADLVAKHSLDRIDLLHVDAEGLDDEIVGQVDFAAPWAPTFVLFEAIHLGEQRYAALKSKLEAAGYRLVDLWPDQLAYRRAPD